VNITTITAKVHLSREVVKGCWKSAELGAEATIAEDQDWQTAQIQLYRDLGTQLVALTSKWSQDGTVVAPQPVSEPQPVQTPPAASNDRPYCQEHGVEFKRFEKGGSTWYSHQTNDGKWCNLRQQQKAV
jgi:hypothetical protein